MYSPFHMLFEQTFQSDRANTGIYSKQSFVQFGADLTPNSRIVAGYMEQGDDRWLDETFAQLETSSAIFRAGRFRSAFGFSNWSELHYTPFVSLPLIRQYDTYIASDTSLYRLDRGVDVRAGGPALEYQVAIVNSDDNDWQIIPRSLNTAVARVQTAAGPAIIGFNGLAAFSGTEMNQKRMLGLDFRWTGRRTQVRGELVKGISTNEGGSGYYVDFFYRPEQLSRTQLGARIQGFHSLDTGSKAQLLTFGARQFLTPTFTMNLNYGLGNNVPEARSTLGWSIQFLSSFRF